MTVQILRLRTPRQPVSTTGLPQWTLTDEAQAILNLPNLTSWREADYGVHTGNGFRWEFINTQAYASAYNRDGPVPGVDGDGYAYLQFGYGNTQFDGVNQGAVRVPSANPLFASNQWSDFVLCSVAIPGSPGAPPIPGGYVWRGQRGPGDNTNPGFNISGSTGRPTLFGGGRSISNILHAGTPVDARDDQRHFYQSGLDGPNTTLRLNIDGNWAVGTATSADTFPSTVTYPDINSTIDGSYVPDPPNFINYLQGRVYVRWTFSVYQPVGGVAAQAIQAYVTMKYNHVFTP